MTYETDPARLIAFPAMTDARQPLTAAFLAVERRARERRPASAQARITPPQFAAYRDAVAAVSRAFDAAEADAWRQARAAGDAPARPAPGDPDAPRAGTIGIAPWTEIAQNLTQTVTHTVIARGTEAFARVMATRGSPAPPGDADTTQNPEDPPPGAAAPPLPVVPTLPAVRSGPCRDARAPRPRRAEASPRIGLRPWTSSGSSPSTIGGWCSPFSASRAAHCAGGTCSRSVVTRVGWRS
ncbi:hypothetical protein [Microbacterium hominis]|uniref:hypothetical protein n=1 Tax=Microbacterium hominis TaxID=162426 RepID=UPI001CC2EA22|nr:hypothetical protein [Microbacterium hominis]